MAFWKVLVVVLAGCGRVAFAPTPAADAPTDAPADAGPLDPRLVLYVPFADMLAPRDEVTAMTLPCTQCPRMVSDARGTVAQFVRAERHCVTVPDALRLRASEFTMMLWMRPNDASGVNMTAYGRPIYGPGSSVNAREIYVTFDNVMATIIHDASSSAGQLTGWHHIAARFDGTSHAMFVDGELAQMGNTLAPAYEPGDELIGCDVNDEMISQWFDGLLDDVRLYNAALTEAEIRVAAGL